MAVNCRTALKAAVLIAVTRKMMYCYLTMEMTVMWVKALVSPTPVFCGRTWTITSDIQQHLPQ